MGSPPFVAQVAVIAAAAAAVQGAPAVRVVDLGLLEPLSGDAAAKLATQIAVQTSAQWRHWLNLSTQSGVQNAFF